MAEKTDKKVVEKIKKKKGGPKPYKKGKSCPKCGTGVNLAEHANRRCCGKCGYTEMK